MTRPIVIGHRGAPAYRPEHTLAGYELAIELGADFVEPDLVSTKDGVLVARHENELSGTTDVGTHVEFADRRTTKSIDGVALSGWFTEDFTLAELRTLRARERIPELRPGSAAHDGQNGIPTFEEVIVLAEGGASRRGRPVGIYPEIKHPGYFASIGLALEARLVATLHEHGFRDESAPVFVQSFEAGSLRRLAGMTDLPLVQLISVSHSAETIGTETLAAVASYAVAIGADKDLVIPRDIDGALTEPSSLVPLAHDAGLLVHAWTFRAENAFLPTGLRRGDPTDPDYFARHGDVDAEYAAFFAAGVDGVFADQPDLAVTARARAAR